MHVLADRQQLSVLVNGTNKRRCLPAYKSEYPPDAPAAKEECVKYMNVLDALMVHVFAHRATIWVPIVWEDGLEVPRLGTYLAEKLVASHAELSYGVVHHKKQEVLDVIREYCSSDRPAIVLRNDAGEQVFYAYQAMGKLQMHECLTGLRILCDKNLAKETLVTLTGLFRIGLRRNMVVPAVPGAGVQLRDGVPDEFADLEFKEDVPAPWAIGVGGLEAFLSENGVAKFTSEGM